MPRDIDRLTFVGKSALQQRRTRKELVESGADGAGRRGNREGGESKAELDIGIIQPAGIPGIPASGCGCLSSLVFDLAGLAAACACGGHQASAEEQHCRRLWNRIGGGAVAADQEHILRSVVRIGEHETERDVSIAGETGK